MVQFESEMSLQKYHLTVLYSSYLILTKKFHSLSVVLHLKHSIHTNNFLTTHNLIKIEKQNYLDN